MREDIIYGYAVRYANTSNVVVLDSIPRACVSIGRNNISSNKEKKT